MFRKFDYSKKWLAKGAWVLVILACVGMAESQLNRQQCNNLIVNVDYDSGVRFIERTDVEKILAYDGSGPVQGNKQKNIGLAALENRIKANPLVGDCEVFHDLEGNLVVDIKQQQPLARWVSTSQNEEWRRAIGFYIDEEGDFVPLSNRFSARVLLVSGPFFQERKSMKSSEGRAVLSLIRLLNGDPFWKAQVTQMNVSKTGNIDLRTALGEQKIAFGRAEDNEAKLRKLRIFYEKVMASDWSRYSLIDLRFHDQIVCE